MVNSPFVVCLRENVSNVAILEDDEDLTQQAFHTNIYIAPLSDTTCSGDEESGGSYKNLTGKQLQAESIATVRTVGSHY